MTSCVSFNLGKLNEGEIKILHSLLGLEKK